MLSFIRADSKNKVFFPITCTIELPLRLQRSSVSLSHPHTHKTPLVHICLSQFSLPNKILVSSLPLLWVLRLFALSPGCDRTQCVSRNTRSDSTQVKPHHISCSGGTPVSLKHTHTRKAKLVFSHSSFCTVGLLGTGELFQALDQRCSKNPTKLLRCGKTSKASCRAVNGL